VYKETKYVTEILKERVLWSIWGTKSIELMKDWKEIPNANDLQLLQFEIIKYIVFTKEIILFNFDHKQRNDSNKTCLNLTTLTL